MCFAAALGIGSASALIEAPLRAAPQMFVTLVYDVAPGARRCPDAEEFRMSVGRQLGYDPFRPATGRHVVVQIVRNETGFDGRIRWSDSSGRWEGDRRLSSRRADCGEFATSVAFAVAVQVQLMATLAPSTQESPAPPPATSTSPQVPLAALPMPSANATSRKPMDPAAPLEHSASRPGVTNADARRPADPAAPSEPVVSPSEPTTFDSRLRLSVGLAPSLAVGVAPQPTGLGRIFVSGRVSLFSLEIGADAALPVTQQSADGSGFSLDRFSVGLAPCGHAGPFAACLTWGLGRMQARGFGVDAPASPAGSFWQVGTRVTQTHDIGDRYFASARLELQLMLSSWTVTLNEQPVWPAPPVSALIGLDFGARIF